MTEPLYAIGQSVAVCAHDLSVVIPQTVVTHCEWRDADPNTFHPLFPDKPLPRRRAGWAYGVAGAPRSRISGLTVTFAESSLRPINPDTEYLESPSHLIEPCNTPEISPVGGEFEICLGCGHDADCHGETK